MSPQELLEQLRPLYDEIKRKPPATADDNCGQALRETIEFYLCLASDGNVVELPRGVKLTNSPAAARGTPPRGRRVPDSNLENWFTYHSPQNHPDPNVALRFEAIRSSGYAMSSVIRDHAPAGPDVTTAIRCVREEVMWANAAIACEQSGDPDPEVQVPVAVLSSRAVSLRLRGEASGVPWLPRGLYEEEDESFRSHDP